MKKTLLVMVCLMLILFPGCKKLKVEEDIRKDGAAEVVITPDLLAAVNISFSGCKAELEYDEGMTVTAETSGPVDGYQWSLDDVELEGETGAAVEIGKDIEPGNHKLDLFVTKGDKIIGSGFVFFDKKDDPNKDTSLEGTWCFTEVYISDVDGGMFEWTREYPYREESGEIIKWYIQFKNNVFKSFERVEEEGLQPKVVLMEEVPYHLEGNKIILAEITDMLGKEATYSIEGMNGDFTGTGVIVEPDHYVEVNISIKAVKANDSDVAGAVPR